MYGAIDYRMCLCSARKRLMVLFFKCNISAVRQLHFSGVKIGIFKVHELYNLIKG